MAYQKAFTQYVTTTANTGDQKFVAVYNDSFRDIKITHLYAGTIVSGLAVGLAVDGFEVARVDTTRFANGNHPLPIDVTVKANANLQIITNDLAGSIRANIPVVIRYETDQLK